MPALGGRALAKMVGLGPIMRHQQDSRDLEYQRRVLNGPTGMFSPLAPQYHDRQQRDYPQPCFGMQHSRWFSEREREARLNRLQDREMQGRHGGLGGVGGMFGPRIRDYPRHGHDFGRRGPQGEIYGGGGGRVPRRGGGLGNRSDTEDSYDSYDSDESESEYSDFDSDSDDGFSGSYERRRPRHRGDMGNAFGRRGRHGRRLGYQSRWDTEYEGRGGISRVPGRYAQDRYRTGGRRQGQGGHGGYSRHRQGRHSW